jgi:pyruvate formate lyase activating enzyme
MKAANQVNRSGGNMKFDFKCFTPSLSKALSGVDNQRAFKNFEKIFFEHYAKRKDTPILTATTLLVPGYVDAFEVEKISTFISSLDESIPYSLLVFHPDHMMRDLPPTPLKQVIECTKIALKNLTNVHVGNAGMLFNCSNSQGEKILKKYL